MVKKNTIILVIILLLIGVIISGCIKKSDVNKVTERANITMVPVKNMEIGKLSENLLVISEIPFQDSPVNKISRPTWKEVEDALPTLKEIGVNTILIWAPYEHRIRTGETIAVNTDKGEVKLKLGYAVHIIDYLQPDTRRGTEEDFIHMIQTAHSLDIKVIAQMQVSLTTPGDYIYDKHPEWILKNIYGKPAIVWPWKGLAYGFWINKTDPGLINYVTEVIIPHWIKNWNLDGVYLDSPAMSYSDLRIKNLCDKTGYVGGNEAITLVEGYYSPEPLVKAMKEKTEQLEKEVGKKLIYAAEATPKTWRDVPDDVVIQACKGNLQVFQTDPRVDRSMGKYFSWVMGYEFRGLLRKVYDGEEYSYSENYVKYFEEETFLDRKYTEIARFINMWIEPINYVDLVKPDHAGNYITLLLTAPGKVVIIGVYQLPPQSELFGKIFNYNAKVLKDYYSKQIKIKKEHTALQSDNIEDALISPKIKGLIAYNRWDENESLIVIVNANGKEVNSIIKTRFMQKEITVYDLLSGEKFKGNPKELNVYMPSYSSRILILEGK